MLKWKLGDKAQWNRRVKRYQPNLQRRNPKKYAIATQTPVSVVVTAIGEWATDDAGPGSGKGSKVRVRRQDTKEELWVYPANLV
jgi:hypothetical protein